MYLRAARLKYTHLAPITIGAQFAIDMGKLIILIIVVVFIIVVWAMLHNNAENKY